MSKKRLTPRERDFCRRYLSTGNPTEAAVLAGYRNKPEDVALQLLSRDDVAKELSRLCEIHKHRASELARVGYERLAFGSIADAVSLLYMDSPSSEVLAKMDLYSVSEIKRPKDGSMEIKFFDRLKALEKLSQGTMSQNGAAPIYDAILRGAQAVSGMSTQGVDDEV